MTTPYSVFISLKAQAQVKALSSKQQKLVLSLIKALAINPRPPGVIKVEGMTGLYSQTVAAFRFIYKVEDQEILILLVK